MKVSSMIFREEFSHKSSNPKNSPVKKPINISENFK